MTTKQNTITAEAAQTIAGLETDEQIVIIEDIEEGGLAVWAPEGDTYIPIGPAGDAYGDRYSDEDDTYEANIFDACVALAEAGHDVWKRHSTPNNATSLQRLNYGWGWAPAR